MATNGNDHLELVVLPPDALDMRTTEGNNNNNNNYNNNTNRVFGVWDYLLNALFYCATSGYARIFPRPLRGLIEFVFLLKAVLSLFILVYVHVVFSQMSANCLDRVKDVWPRDGILRVEILHSFQGSNAEQTGTINELFTLEKSYEREYKQKSMDKSAEKSEKESLFNRFTKTNSPGNKGEVDIEPSTEELVDNKFQKTNTPKPNFEDEKKEMSSSTTKTNCHNTSKLNFSIVEDSAQFGFTKYPNSSVRGVLGIDSLLQSTASTKLPLIDDHEVIFFETFIVEYSLERGFLELSPSSRNRSGIPVMLVILESTPNKFFGDSVDQYFLKYFLGYNDLLISSVKSLSETEQRKGFIRNVITGMYYGCSDICKTRLSYIQSFFSMVIFTILITTFIRHSNNQIFVFMVNLMRQLNVHGSLSFSAAPHLIVLLALVGVWVTMFNFFEYNHTVFCIILIVWVADQYNTIFSRCPISKKHWLKFFYLYHFLFYAYHYRFNGQHSNLALICSWFFIQHSMIHFYHNYDLPYLLQQVQPHTR